MAEDDRLGPATALRTGHCGAVTAADVGRQVTLCGWVARRREHGEHLAFVDLRDHTGVVQCVVEGAHDLRAEFVVRVAGSRSAGGSRAGGSTASTWPSSTCATTPAWCSAS